MNKNNQQKSNNVVKRKFAESAPIQSLKPQEKPSPKPERQDNTQTSEQNNQDNNKKD